MMKVAKFDVALLSSTERGYGLKKEVHIWLTPTDIINANLMILIAYVIMGHPDWARSNIKLYSVLPSMNIDEEKKKFAELIEDGQLPISENNIEYIARNEVKDLKQIINEYSRDADLSIIGFREESNKLHANGIFTGYEGIGNILFVNADEAIQIK